MSSGNFRFETLSEVRYAKSHESKTIKRYTVHVT